jgi:hypothetical protein
MALLVLLLIALAVVAAARVGRLLLGSSKDERRSVERYGDALARLRRLPEQAEGRPGRRAPARRASVGRAASSHRLGAVGSRLRVEDSGRSRSGGTRSPAMLLDHPSDPSGLDDEVEDLAGVEPGEGLAALSYLDAPPAARQVARIIGLDRPQETRPTGVEGNARLTGTTGLLLIVLFFLEGLTIPFISRLISWHIVIGLALIPPVLVKLCSVLWRFSRYYLGDPRYRAAGPPHPLLRALGPFVVLSTVALLASGVALWLAGPGHTTLLRIHQVSFVLWFVVVAVHVVSHILRASRLAAADAAEAKAQRAGANPVRQRAARARRTLVAGSLLVGLALGALGRTVTTGWGPSVFHHHRVVRVSPPTSSATGSTLRPRPGQGIPD